jgi:hypothetical protein
MIASVINMAQTTVGLVLFCVLGVTGVVSDVQIEDHGLSAYVEGLGGGIALPPVAYYGYHYELNSDWVRRHEAGHLEQHHEIGMWYYLAVGLPSVLDVFGLDPTGIGAMVERDAWERGGWIYDAQ